MCYDWEWAVPVYKIVNWYLLPGTVPGTDGLLAYVH